MEASAQNVSGWLPHALQKHQKQNQHRMLVPVCAHIYIYIYRARGRGRNYVGVSSRSELLDATVGSNVFNAVTEGDFVL